MSVRLFLAGFWVVLGLFGCASPGVAPVADRGTGSGGATSPAAPAPRAGYYVVKPGDTLNAISRQTNVPVRDLVVWNNLASANQISVGQELRVIPPEGTQVRPVSPTDGVEVHPVGVAPGPTVTPPSAGTPLKETPRGGKVPYSDQAWSQAQTADGAPAAAPAGPATKPEAPETAEPRPGAQPAPGSDWLWPVDGKVISGFADGNGKGIDIAGKVGDPVLASAAGKVVYAGSGLRGYGKLVIIKHDDSFLTAYAHNRQLLVNEGQAVSKGQKIAELGNTDADRPKLHFEIRRQGKPVDPLKFLPNR